MHGACFYELRPTDTSGLSLSGGLQQRLVIARVIALEPEVLSLEHGQAN